MKTFKQIKEEIANVSAGVGVRGFGDVSGMPKVGEEDKENSHIDRVIQGAKEYSAEVDQFIKNNTEGVYTWEGGFDWWVNRKGVAKYTKTHLAEPLGFTPLTPQSAKAFGIVQEDITNTTSDAGPGLGDNPSKEVFPGKTKKNKPVWPMFRRLPLQLEDIGGITASLGSIGNVTGEAIPGTGDDAQAFVRPKDQKKKKKIEDPRMFGMFRRKSFKQHLEERLKRKK